MENACPVFFLQPFTQEEERNIRASVCALGEVDEGADWGKILRDDTSGCVSAAVSTLFQRLGLRSQLPFEGDLR